MGLFTIRKVQYAVYFCMDTVCTGDVKSHKYGHS